MYYAHTSIHSVYYASMRTVLPSRCITLEVVNEAQNNCALKCRPIMKRRRILSSTIRQIPQNIVFSELLFSRSSVFFHANVDLTTMYVFFSVHKHKEEEELFCYKNKLVILIGFIEQDTHFCFRNCYRFKFQLKWITFLYEMNMNWSIKEEIDR